MLTANIRAAQAELPVPLALENIAALVSWPDDELTEADFLTELVERTGALLLLDVANLYTAQVNFGLDPVATLDRLPLCRVAYVHVAGGVCATASGTTPTPTRSARTILDVLAALAARTAPPGVLLERDDAYPSDAELAAELASIRTVLTVPPSADPPPAARR